MRGIRIVSMLMTWSICRNLHLAGSFSDVRWFSSGIFLLSCMAQLLSINSITKFLRCPLPSSFKLLGDPKVNNAVVIYGFETWEADLSTLYFYSSVQLKVVDEQPALALSVISKKLGTDPIDPLASGVCRNIFLLTMLLASPFRLDVCDTRGRSSLSSLFLVFFLYVRRCREKSSQEISKAAGNDVAAAKYYSAHHPTNRVVESRDQLTS